MRTSSYTIYVDLPDHPDEMLLVHGYTGAYDKVSRRVASYLRSQEERPVAPPLYGTWSSDPEERADDVAPSAQTLAILRHRGYLTRLRSDQEEAFFARFVTRLHERAAQRMPSYLFIPTYDCNLRCSYCFQDHLRTDSSFRHLLRTMRPAMVDRIFGALAQIEARHCLPAGNRRREIGFFGGEPLLAAHRPLVEHVMARASALGEVAFWAVTNGSELGAYRDLLGPGKIARLQITLDGSPGGHDRRRVYPDGSGTFARIAASVTMALERGTRVSIRINVNRRNLGELPALADEIATRGWPRWAGFSAYTAPIQVYDRAAAGLNLLSSWQLDQEMTRLRRQHTAMALIGRPDEAIRRRARQLFAGKKETLPRFRPAFCAAHDRMYLFDPFGDVYACWEKTGDPARRIATITAAGEVEFRPEREQEWRQRTVAANPVCRRCRYALHCGGGCAVLALEVRGKLQSSYCDGYAKRFRASIAEAYLDHAAGRPAVAGPDLVCDL